jgi:hypothetical protein
LPSEARAADFVAGRAADTARWLPIESAEAVESEARGWRLHPAQPSSGNQGLQRRGDQDKKATFALLWRTADPAHPNDHGSVQDRAKVTWRFALTLDAGAK